MKTVLVVDDEKNTRLFLKEALGREAYRVLLAASGEEALIMVKEEKPDLVLLDIKMPGMNGLEVLQRIKEIDKKIAVVICTAYGGMEKDFTIVSTGVDGFLTKPIKLNELKAKIGDILVKRLVEGEE